MSVVVFSTKREAEAFAKSVDEALGYPETAETCSAVPVGGGIHVTHPHCCTQRHAAPIEGENAWAYQADARVLNAKADVVEQVLRERPPVKRAEFSEKKPDRDTLPDAKVVDATELADRR